MGKILRVHPDAPDESVLSVAADVILNEGVIVYPTETLYGIGANALSRTAIAKVIKAKKRPDNKPILVIVNSAKMLGKLVARIPDSARLLMNRFWPGPLTIVFEVASGIPEVLTQQTGTIGIRIPSNKFCLDLLDRSKCPLTSTSANVSGEPVHRTVDEIRKNVNEGIDLYIDAGRLPESKPSTVVSVAGKKPKLIREGVISFDSLYRVLPELER